MIVTATDQPEPEEAQVEKSKANMPLTRKFLTQTQIVRAFRKLIITSPRLALASSSQVNLILVTMQRID
jgi:hypothetical protein